MNLRTLLRAGYLLPGIPFFILRLRRRAARCRSSSDFLDLANRSSFRALNIRPTQVRSEILAFLDLVRREKCRRVLEIGTARGGTLFLLSRTCPPGSLLVSVDLPWSPGLGYPSWKRLILRAFPPPGSRVVPLQADSHLAETVERVQELMGREIDLLFIDGDHSHEGVRRDFELYSPLVRAGGLIAFHDIVPGIEEKVGGVPRFWREVRERHEYHELIEDVQQGGFGIGVVRVGREEAISATEVAKGGAQDPERVR